MAEHVAHNDLVPGSNPGRPTSGTLARYSILARAAIMRRKSRSGARLIELAIFAVLPADRRRRAGVCHWYDLDLSLLLTYGPDCAASRAGWPPAHPCTHRHARARAKPTTVATPTPALAPATPAGQVLLVSYLRTDPRVADNTRQAILCPDDAVEYLMQRDSRGFGVVPGAGCPAGRRLQRPPRFGRREGWASSNVLSAPSWPVASAAP